MRICAIDDDPVMLQHLINMLTELGFEVVSALSVKTALDLIAIHHCDAAVVDILPPDRDGLDFIMQARRDYPGLRIVAITGGGRVGAGPLLRMADGLGADMTLAKPFSASELEVALAAG